MRKSIKVNQVLDLRVAPLSKSGFGYKEIAAKLEISVRTVTASFAKNGESFCFQKHSSQQRLELPI